LKDAKSIQEKRRKLEQQRQEIVALKVTIEDLESELQILNS
jgi:cell division protein FtsB